MHTKGGGGVLRGMKHAVDWIRVEGLSHCPACMVSTPLPVLAESSAMRERGGLAQGLGI